MLDRKYIIENEVLVKDNLSRRGSDFSKHIDDLLHIEKQRRAMIQETEDLRHSRKSLQEKFKQDHSEELKNQLKSISDNLKELEEKLQEVEKQSEEKSLLLPNLLHNKVPTGSTSEENSEVYKDEKDLAKKRDRQITPHWDIKGKEHAIDFERASKIAGTRFYLLSGDFARL